MLATQDLNFLLVRLDEVLLFLVLLAAHAIDPAPP